MRSSYKTTVKYLLKSGEVFAISFLQSLFHFVATSSKSSRSSTAGTDKAGRAAEGREMVKWCLHPSSAKDAILQWDPLTWLVLQVLEVYSSRWTILWWKTC